MDTSTFTSTKNMSYVRAVETLYGSRKDKVGTFQFASVLDDVLEEMYTNKTTNCVPRVSPTPEELHKIFPKPKFIKVLIVATRRDNVDALFYKWLKRYRSTYRFRCDTTEEDNTLPARLPMPLEWNNLRPMVHVLRFPPVEVYFKRNEERRLRGVCAAMYGELIDTLRKSGVQIVCASNRAHDDLKSFGKPGRTKVHVLEKLEDHPNPLSVLNKPLRKNKGRPIAWELLLTKNANKKVKMFSDTTLDFYLTK